VGARAGGLIRGRVLHGERRTQRVGLRRTRRAVDFRRRQRRGHRGRRRRRGRLAATAGGHERRGRGGNEEREQSVLQRTFPFLERFAAFEHDDVPLQERYAIRTARRLENGGDGL